MDQPLSVFRGNQGFSNNWLRVVPRTRFGAFARGAKVVLYTKKSGAHLRIIDGGSGYLCEMEPVAHFGLGRDEASSVEVTWPDGKMLSRSVANREMNSVLEILYPRDEDKLQNTAPLECGQGFSQQDNGHCMDTNECIQFPFVCPRDKPVCVNTYGSYRCRTNKRCSRGYEPNEDGTSLRGSSGLSRWVFLGCL
uniref:W307 n=1 Tax=Rattus norvegicus TaxID=10116 RepID=Q9QX63_RAT|nr:W307 [Rattus norvegicus]